MVFVEVGSVMAETTSVTPTTRVLAVLANTAVTVRHVTTQLSGLLLVGSHPGTNGKDLSRRSSTESEDFYLIEDLGRPKYTRVVSKSCQHNTLSL